MIDSSSYAKKIDFIISGPDKYINFAFGSIWDIQEGLTTPYIQGLKIAHKNNVKFGAAYYREGSGTEEDPYQIYTEEDLYQIRNARYAYFKLMNDIELDTYSNWPSIDNFYGVLDGDNHTITNLNIKNSFITNVTI